MSPRRLLSDTNASSAAEFALVVPLLILLLFAVIDGGRWLWEYNRIEKATQMGARFAVVTDPPAAGITSTSYVGISGLTQGDPIPLAAFGTIRCTSSGCSCLVTPCPSIGTVTASNFTAIVNRMKLFAGEISAANVTVDYSGSGLGYAGNPNGADISPIVRITVGSPTAMNFQPLSYLTFKQTGITMPTFTAALTAEDLSGSASN